MLSMMNLARMRLSLLGMVLVTLIFALLMTLVFAQPASAAWGTRVTHSSGSQLNTGLLVASDKNNFSGTDKFLARGSSAWNKDAFRINTRCRYGIVYSSRRGMYTAPSGVQINLLYGEVVTVKPLGCASY